MPRIVLPLPVVYGVHTRQWRHCDNCDLCETRTKTALFRYVRTTESMSREKIEPSTKHYPTCDILGIGEAPGESEDIKGYPFSGPSGKLLDRTWFGAYELFWQSHSRSRSPIVGLTNVIGCYPLDQNGHGRTPHKIEIDACRHRLLQLIVSAKPTWIVCIGNVAKANIPGSFADAMKNFPWLAGISHVTHPSAILRIDNKARRVTEEAIYRTEFASILESWLKHKVATEALQRKVSV